MALLAGTLVLAALMLAIAGVVLMTRVELPAGMSPVSGSTRSRRSALGGTTDRLAARLGPRVAQALPLRMVADIDQRLAASGQRTDDGASAFVGRVAAQAALAAAAALPVGVRSPVLVLLVPLAVVLQANGRLTGQARRRQERIERELPDLLDVLAVTLGAGLTFRGALDRVAQANEGPLGQEFVATLREMDVGSTRREAFAALRDRNPAPSLRRFVGSFLQAEELGAPLSATVIDLANELRREAAHNARQRAARAEPRISLAVSVFIVPASAALLIGGLILGSDIDLGRLLGR